MLPFTLHLPIQPTVPHPYLQTPKHPRSKKTCASTTHNLTTSATPSLTLCLANSKTITITATLCDYILFWYCIGSVVVVGVQVKTHGDIRTTVALMRWYVDVEFFKYLLGSELVGSL